LSRNTLSRWYLMSMRVHVLLIRAGAAYSVGSRCEEAEHSLE
jgi:hypothetical protein